MNRERAFCESKPKEFARFCAEQKVKELKYELESLTKRWMIVQALLTKAKDTLDAIPR